MAQENIKSNESSAQTPLEELSEIFVDDMKEVNRIVLERMGSDVPLIQELSAYIISAGGKRIRPLLTLTCTSLFDGGMSRAHNLAATVEYIHTATLLHDDVVDESDERRGKATANTIFGNQASVLVGDFLFSRAFQMMVHDGSLEVLRILSDASAIITQGEVMQLMTAGNIDTSMDAYMQVIKAKTAALFAASCEVGPVIANENPEIAQSIASYGMNLGIAFQISDDVLDYAASQEKFGKNIGDDFQEAKMTAPIIYAIQNADAEEKEFWTRTIGNKEQHDGDLEQALSYFDKYQTLEKSMQLAKDYARKAKDDLKTLPDSKKKSILMDLANFTVEREH